MELKEKLAGLKARKRELESLLRNSSQRSSGYGSDWDYGYGPYGYDLFGSYDDWDEEDEEDEEEKMRKLKLGFGVWPGGNHGSESGEPSEVAGASEDSGAVNGGNFSDLVNGAFGGGKQGASIEAAPAPESETQATKDDWDELFNRSSRNGKIFDDYSLGTSDIDQAADEPESPTEEPASGSFDDLVKGAFGGAPQTGFENGESASGGDWGDEQGDILTGAYRREGNGKIFDDYSLGTSDIDQAADTGAAPESTANDPDDNWLDKIFGGRGKILGGSVETVDRGTDKRQDPPGVLTSGTEGLLASTNDDYMLGDKPLVAWGKEGEKLIADKPQNMTPEEKESVKQAIATMKYAGYVKEAKQAEELLAQNKIKIQKGLNGSWRGALGETTNPKIAFGNPYIALENEALVNMQIPNDETRKYYKRLSIASILLHELVHWDQNKLIADENTAWTQEIEFINKLAEILKKKDPNSYKIPETYEYLDSRAREGRKYLSH